MKKLFIAIIALSLSACATTGDPKPELGTAPAAKMPRLSAPLKERAEPLPPITDRSLGGIHKDGVNTDVKYNDLALRYNFIINAWDCVADALEKREASSNAVDKCLAGAGELPK